MNDEENTKKLMELYKNKNYCPSCSYCIATSNDDYVCELLGSDSYIEASSEFTCLAWEKQTPQNRGTDAKVPHSET